jgi:hypothetical protein
MFEHARTRARELGGLSLEWESDPNAVGFYEKMGGRYLREGQPKESGEPYPVMGISLP